MGIPDEAGFVADAIRLSREPLAFAVASQNDRPELESLFTLIAQRVQAIEPEQAKQAAFGKTLLGAKEEKAPLSQWFAASQTKK